MKTAISALTLLLMLGGCAPAKLELKRAPYTGQNHFEASKDEILNKLQQEDDLEGVQTSAIDRDYEVVVTKSETQYFVQDGKVVSMIRAPKADEDKLIYWRYRFQGEAYRDRELPSDGKMGHRLALRELACDAKGTGVVYDPNSERVKRVYYYDPK